MPQQYVVRWSGGPIGAGATVLHFNSIGSGTAAQGIANAVRACYDAIKARINSDILFTFDTEVKEIANDGTLLGVYAVTPPAAVAGTGTGQYAAGTGALIRHTTGVIVAGRRLQGRTFMVPLNGDCYSNLGTIGGAVVTTFNSAFAAMAITLGGLGTPLAVWSRTGAVTAPVSASVCVSRVSTLRSRNDRV